MLSWLFSWPSSLVFFTYEGRKIAVTRPATHEDAVALVKNTFSALKTVPHDKVIISACLSDHQGEGIVEIAPTAWKLAASGVNHFKVGVLEEGVNVAVVEEVKKERTDSQGFSVFVKSGTGKIHCITDLHSTDNIYSVKIKYEDLVAVPVDQQRFIFAGKQLEDDRTLADYSITGGETIHYVLRLRGGKPVIYLFPPTPISVKVHLSLVPQWRFSALYPQPIKGSFREGKSSQTTEWNVGANPSGMMTVEGSFVEVAYLFWEAETESSIDLLDSPPVSRSPSPVPEAAREMLRPHAGFVPGTTKCSPRDSVVLSMHDVPPYLETALLELGLHTEARTSFITYWLPSFLKHEHLALRFVPQVDYEASALLDINPKPDVVTRVFMLFQGIPPDRLADWEEARQRSLVDVNMWKGIVGVDDTRQSDESLFRVLEWGGMEVR